MKILKNQLLRKIIIVLAILMIFSTIIPKQTKAWDLGGILIKPISSVILATIIPVDVTLGLTLNGISMTFDTISAVVELFVQDNVAALNSISDALQKLFIGPDTIFSGKVQMLDANIFEAKELTGTNDIAEIVSALKSKSSLSSGLDTLSDTFSPGNLVVATIKEAVATIYVTIRNICGFIMLAGLIFTGIRVLITSNMPTKMAQWKALLQDWFVGMALLIFSHVIMIGVFFISDSITQALNLSLNGFGGINFNLIIQCLSSFDSAEQTICLIMLTYLIFLTVVFAIAYFKRALWVCVLIVIAPIVSIMYAFGSQTKQIYLSWIREYMMTVFVQPFHIVIYYILLGIPLNMANSTGGFSGDITNIFVITYALGAMAFIRPAEKYVRNLFKFDQGIAEKASFDSGKKTLVDIGKVVATVALTAVTAGAGGAAVGALKAGSLAAKGAGAASKAAGAASKVANVGKNVLGPGNPGGKAFDTLSKGFNNLEGKFGNSTDLIDADIAKPKSDFRDKMIEFDEEEREKNFLNQTDDDRAFLETMYRDSLDPEAGRINYDAEQLEQMALDIAGENATAEELNEIRESLGLNQEQIEVEIDNEDDGPTEVEIDNENNEGAQNIDKGNINAENVIINAGNIKFYGEVDKEENNSNDDNDDEHEDDEAENDDGNEEEKDNEANGDVEEENNDEKIKVKEGEGESSSKKEKGYGFITTPVKNFVEMQQVALGKKGIFETIDGIDPNSQLAKITEPLMSSKLGQTLKTFEDLGGIKQLHEGFNTIRDGFYVTPPPMDWKETNAAMGERQKEREEKIKFSMVNNEEFQNYIMYDEKGPKFYEKYKAQYPDKSEAYVRELALDKAKDKIKSLSDQYVQLGVRDVPVMYELDKDRKKYGYTPQEAVRQRVEFEKFNANVENVAYINEHYNENVQTVSEAIEPAREYYNKGYTNAADMNLVHELTQALNVSKEMGMQLDGILRKRGGEINYDQAKLTSSQKDRLDKILEQYKTIQYRDTQEKRTRRYTDDRNDNNPTNNDPIRYRDSSDTKRKRKEGDNL